MYISDEERDKFVAQTAIQKGVKVDDLMAMEADSYTQIVRNADELIRLANKVEIPYMV